MRHRLGVRDRQQWATDDEMDALKRADLSADYDEAHLRVNRLLDMLAEQIDASQSEAVKTVLPFALARELACAIAFESAGEDSETIEQARETLGEAFAAGWAHGLMAAMAKP